MFRKIVLFSFLLSAVGSLSAQEQVKVLHADSSSFFRKENLYKLLGNVHILHERENLKVWCDSIYRFDFPDSSYLEAFGRVKAIKNDSLHIWCDYLHYDSNKRFAQFRGNVRMEDPSTILTTQKLDYDGVFEYSYYFDGGKLEDNVNVLTSQRGTYFNQTKIAVFRDDVRVNSPDYLIVSDTLRYNTFTKLVSIIGPTDIYGKNDTTNTLYSEDGWYDSATGHAELYKNNRVTHASYTAWADTMIIDSLSQQADMYRNVTVVDTLNKAIIKGEYAKADQVAGISFVTDKALLILVMESDSLFLHSDTLRMVREWQVTQRDSVIPRTDTVFIDKSGLRAERDTLAGMRELLTARKESMLACLDSLRGAKDSLQNLPDSLVNRQDSGWLKADSLVAEVASRITADESRWETIDNRLTQIDSLLAGKDTLLIPNDTKLTLTDSLEVSIIRGYYNTRFYSRDLQGLCDSMEYRTADSLILLFTEPVVWASDNQMTAEVITFLLGDGEPREFKLLNNALMISKRADSEEMFDQAKGRNITGYFRNKDLYQILIEGNGETIYFPEDNRAIIGVNDATSANIRILVKERKVTAITFLNETNGKLNPLFIRDPKEARLKEFQWLQEWRPLDRDDIYHNPKKEPRPGEVLLPAATDEPNEDPAEK